MTNLHCPACGQVADGDRRDPDFFWCQGCLTGWLICRLDPVNRWLADRDLFDELRGIGEHLPGAGVTITLNKTGGAT